MIICFLFIVCYLFFKEDGICCETFIVLVWLVEMKVKCLNNIL